MTIEHGGNLHAACLRYGGKPDASMDLSTGINPASWAVPAVPQSVWHRLPENDGVLEEAAAHYYGVAATQLMAVPGSQFAIEQVPNIVRAASVAIPHPGYAEHGPAWSRAGHQLAHYRSLEELQVLIDSGEAQHAVVINPNNPSCEHTPRERLLALASQLTAGGGLLLVDEAFIDTRPQESLCGHDTDQAIVVLRSLGKFFGLAGLRLGFVMSSSPILSKLMALMPPWAVSHPARWIGERALADLEWQQSQRVALPPAAVAWCTFLAEQFPQCEVASTDFFVSLRGAENLCARVFEGLAKRQILVRQLQPIDGRAGLRFGLPTPAQLEDVKHALYRVSQDMA
ncbi:MAG: threonine-phosphate decarboxylase CobD [Pseudomonadota bacterium]